MGVVGIEPNQPLLSPGGRSLESVLFEEKKSGSAIVKEFSIEGSDAGPSWEKK